MFQKMFLKLDGFLAHFLIQYCCERSTVYMKVVGYARVSTLDQNLDRQIDALKENNVDLIYQEKMTGTKSQRPELNRMLEELNPGDTVLICDLTRISRSTRDLLNIFDKIKSKGAYIKSLKDTWLNTTTGANNPYTDFLFTVMAGLSALERDLTSERTKEGLAAAKRRGRNGGRPKGENPQTEVVLKLYRSGNKMNDIVKITKLSRSTIYRIVKKNTGSKAVPLRGQMKIEDIIE